MFVQCHVSRTYHTIVSHNTQTSMILHQQSKTDKRNTHSAHIHTNIHTDTHKHINGTSIISTNTHTHTPVVPLSISGSTDEHRSDRIRSAGPCNGLYIVISGHICHIIDITHRFSSVMSARHLTNGAE